MRLGDCAGGDVFFLRILQGSERVRFLITILLSPCPVNSTFTFRLSSSGTSHDTPAAQRTAIFRAHLQRGARARQTTMLRHFAPSSWGSGGRSSSSQGGGKSERGRSEDDPSSTTRCVVCFDTFLLKEQGVSCRNTDALSRHFLCFQCLSSHVDARGDWLRELNQLAASETEALASGDTRRAREISGEVHCPVQGCGGAGGRLPFELFYFTQSRVVVFPVPILLKRFFLFL